MGIHVKHLYYFGHQMGRQTDSKIRNQLSEALQALGKLMQQMLQLQRAQQTDGYSEVIVELNQLLGKRSIGYIKILASLPVADFNSMCEPLCQLIACNIGSSKQLNAQFPEYLSALLALLYLDDSAWQLDEQRQAQPWTLQLLRGCRELYKAETNQNYALSLLYYYLKLLNTRQSSPAADVKRPYVDLVKKFVNFFEQKALPYADEHWYVDFLLVFVRLQKQLHQVDQKVPSFDYFWQCLDSSEAYAAHFQLLQCLINMIMKFTGSNSSSLAPSCSSNDASCQSLRKHCVFSLGCCATFAYSNWQSQATLPKVNLID